MAAQPKTPRHWHITRDIKPRGECAACDEYWAQYDRSDEKVWEEKNPWKTS